MPPRICVGFHSSDPRKGGDLLNEALCKLAGIIPNDRSIEIELQVFGEAGSKGKSPWPFKKHYFVIVNAEDKLSALYSISEAMLLPSGQDNPSNTGVESHACGTPVIAFNIGGLADIVEAGKTGFLVEPFDTTVFARVIAPLINSPHLVATLKVNSRKRALTNWSFVRVAATYTDLYREIAHCKR